MYGRKYVFLIKVMEKLLQSHWKVMGKEWNLKNKSVWHNESEHASIAYWAAESGPEQFKAGFFRATQYKYFPLWIRVVQLLYIYYMIENTTEQNWYL